MSPRPQSPALLAYNASVASIRNDTAQRRICKCTARARVNAAFDAYLLALTTPEEKAWWLANGQPVEGNIITEGE